MDINATYDLINPPAIYCQKPDIEKYREEDVRCLPIAIKSEDNLYVIIGLKESAKKLVVDADVAPLVVTASDCVDKCRNVLGLKVNEIAKLIGISRATLDLHRKGSPIKDMDSYERLFAFVGQIEAVYGTELSKGIRNILVERKTLAQHLISCKNDFSKCTSVIEEVASKLGNVNTFKTVIDTDKANLRLSGIGRIA